MRSRLNPIKKILLFIAVLCLSFAAMSATAGNKYYWVPNAAGSADGNWSDLSHWASTSGGAGGAYVQVPKSTDDVYFDDKSSASSTQAFTVSLQNTVVCHQITWSSTVVAGSKIASLSTTELDVFGPISFGVGNYSTADKSFTGFLGKLVITGSGVLDFNGLSFGNGSTVEVNTAGSYTIPSAIGNAGSNGITDWTVSAGSLNFGGEVHVASLLINNAPTVNFSAPIAIANSLQVNASSAVTFQDTLRAGAVQLPNCSTIDCQKPVLAGSVTANGGKLIHFEDAVQLSGNLSVQSYAHAQFDHSISVANVTTSLCDTLNFAGAITASSAVSVSNSSVLTFQQAITAQNLLVKTCPTVTFSAPVNVSASIQVSGASNSVSFLIPITTASLALDNCQQVTFSKPVHTLTGTLTCTNNNNVDFNDVLTVDGSFVASGGSVNVNKVSTLTNFAAINSAQVVVNDSTTLQSLTVSNLSNVKLNKGLKTTPNSTTTVTGNSTVYIAPHSQTTSVVSVTKSSYTADYPQFINGTTAGVSLQFSQLSASTPCSMKGVTIKTINNSLYCATNNPAFVDFAPMHLTSWGGPTTITNVKAKSLDARYVNSDNIMGSLAQISGSAIDSLYLFNTDAFLSQDTIIYSSIDSICRVKIDTTTAKEVVIQKEMHLNRGSILESNDLDNAITSNLPQRFTFSRGQLFLQNGATLYIGDQAGCNRRSTLSFVDLLLAASGSATINSNNLILDYSRVLIHKSKPLVPVSPSINAGSNSYATPESVNTGWTPPAGVGSQAYYWIGPICTAGNYSSYGKLYDPHNWSTDPNSVVGTPDPSNTCVPELADSVIFRNDSYVYLPNIADLPTTNIVGFLLTNAAMEVNFHGSFYNAGIKSNLQSNILNFYPTVRKYNYVASPKPFSANVTNINFETDRGQTQPQVANDSMPTTELHFMDDFSVLTTFLGGAMNVSFRTGNYFSHGHTFYMDNSHTLIWTQKKSTRSMNCNYDFSKSTLIYSSNGTFDFTTLRPGGFAFAPDSIYSSSTTTGNTITNPSMTLQLHDSLSMIYAQTDGYIVGKMGDSSTINTVHSGSVFALSMSTGAHIINALAGAAAPMPLGISPIANFNTSVNAPARIDTLLTQSELNFSSGVTATGQLQCDVLGLPGGKTCTFDSMMIEITSTNGLLGSDCDQGIATVQNGQFTSSFNQDVPFVSLLNNQARGSGIFKYDPGFADQASTGWVQGPYPLYARKLYWYGGPGPFYDASHWSLASGSMLDQSGGNDVGLGNCPPLFRDTAIIDDSGLVGADSITITRPIVVKCFYVQPTTKSVVLNFDTPTNSSITVSGDVILGDQATLYNTSIGNSLNKLTLAGPDSSYVYVSAKSPHYTVLNQVSFQAQDSASYYNIVNLGNEVLGVTSLSTGIYDFNFPATSFPLLDGTWNFSSSSLTDSLTVRFNTSPIEGYGTLNFYMQANLNVNTKNVTFTHLNIYKYLSALPLQIDRVNTSGYVHFNNPNPSDYIHVLTGAPQSTGVYQIDSAIMNGDYYSIDHTNYLPLVLATAQGTISNIQHLDSAKMEQGYFNIHDVVHLNQLLASSNYSYGSLTNIDELDSAYMQENANYSISHVGLLKYLSVPYPGTVNTVQHLVYANVGALPNMSTFQFLNIDTLEQFIINPVTALKASLVNVKYARMIENPSRNNGELFLQQIGIDTIYNESAIVHYTDTVRIHKQMVWLPGTRQLQDPNSLLWIDNAAEFSANGTGGLETFWRSSVLGQQAYVRKDSDLLCADYIYIQDLWAIGNGNGSGGNSLIDTSLSSSFLPTMATSGRARFMGGGNADNEGNNAGWDLLPYPPIPTARIDDKSFYACDTAAPTFVVPILVSSGFPFELKYNYTTKTGTVYVDTIPITKASMTGTGTLLDPYLFYAIVPKKDPIHPIDTVTTFTLTHITASRCDVISVDLNSKMNISVKSNVEFIHPSVTIDMANDLLEYRYRIHNCGIHATPSDSIPVSIYLEQDTAFTQMHLSWYEGVISIGDTTAWITDTVRGIQQLGNFKITAMLNSDSSEALGTQFPECSFMGNVYRSPIYRITAVPDTFDVVEFSVKNKLDVLANDQYADSTFPLKVSGIWKLPQQGVVNNDAQFLYYDAPNYYCAGSTDTLGYYVADGYGRVDSALVYIHFTPFICSHRTQDDYISVLANTSTNLQVLTNDTLVRGDLLESILYHSFSMGTVSINPSTQTLLLQSNDVLGVDSFQYVLYSSLLNCSDTAWVHVHVMDAPTYLSPVACSLTPAPSPIALDTKVLAAIPHLSNTSSVLVGDVNNDDTTELVVALSAPMDSISYGKNIAVVNAQSGMVERTISTPYFSTSGGFSYAIGNVVSSNPGAEIIIAASDFGNTSNANKLLCYSLSTGSLLWTSSSVQKPMAKDSVFGDVMIADINHDGTPEVMTMGEIFNAQTGAYICGLSQMPQSDKGLSYVNYDPTGTIPAHYYSMPALGNVLGNEDLELVAGRQVYAVDVINGKLKLLEQMNAFDPQRKDGYTALIDMNNDHYLDVVVASSDQQNNRGYYIWNGQTADTIGIYHSLNKLPYIDFPAFSDLKGNGVVQAIFQSKATVFDINGDGVKEVLTNDARGLHVVSNGVEVANALDGTTRYAKLGWSSFDQPVVADIDGDGYADIVSVFNNEIRVSKSKKGMGRWTSARNVWNEYRYIDIFVNNDLSISKQPLDPTLQVNTPSGPKMIFNHLMEQAHNYDTQGNMIITAPDLQMDLVTALFNANRDSLVFKLNFSNQGERNYPSSDSCIAFYDGDPAAGGKLFFVGGIPRKLIAGTQDSTSFSFPQVQINAYSNSIYIQLNNQGLGLNDRTVVLPECGAKYSNNTGLFVQDEIQANDFSWFFDDRSQLTTPTINSASLLQAVDGNNQAIPNADLFISPAQLLALQNAPSIGAYPITYYSPHGRSKRITVILHRNDTTRVRSGNEFIAANNFMRKLSEAPQLDAPSTQLASQVWALNIQPDTALPITNIHVNTTQLATIQQATTVGIYPLTFFTDNNTPTSIYVFLTDNDTATIDTTHLAKDVIAADYFVWSLDSASFLDPLQSADTAHVLAYDLSLGTEISHNLIQADPAELATIQSATSVGVYPLSFYTPKGTKVSIKVLLTVNDVNTSDLHGANNDFIGANHFIWFVEDLNQLNERVAKDTSDTHSFNLNTGNVIPRTLQTVDPQQLETILAQQSYGRFPLTFSTPLGTFATVQVTLLVRDSGSYSPDCGEYITGKDFTVDMMEVKNLNKAQIIEDASIWGMYFDHIGTLMDTSSILLDTADYAALHNLIFPDTTLLLHFSTPCGTLDSIHITVVATFDTLQLRTGLVVFGLPSTLCDTAICDVDDPYTVSDFWGMDTAKNQGRLYVILNDSVELNAKITLKDDASIHSVYSTSIGNKNYLPIHPVPGQHYSMGTMDIYRDSLLSPDADGYLTIQIYLHHMSSSVKIYFSNDFDHDHFINAVERNTCIKKVNGIFNEWYFNSPVGDDNNDGVPNLIEAKNDWTHLYDIDTDGDCIPDFMDEDSNGDGVPDYVEKFNGTRLDSIGNTIRVFQAISPNGDHLGNDQLYIQNIRKFPQNTVTLYDRYGGIIYQQSGYDNGDKSFAGYPNIGNTIHRVKMGTYYYCVEYFDPFTQKNVVKSGFVEIRY